jgi:hypothetical protein
VSYIDAEEFILLHTNHPQKFESFEGEETLLRYNFLGREQKSIVEAVEFNFKMNYGHIEYRISNRNTNLCKDNNFELSGQLDLSKDSLDNHFRKVLYQRSDPSSNLRGSYYICIKALKYTSFSVTPAPQVKESHRDSRLQINDLPAGE